MEKAWSTLNSLKAPYEVTFTDEEKINELLNKFHKHPDRTTSELVLNEKEKLDNLADPKLKTFSNFKERIFTRYNYLSPDAEEESFQYAHQEETVSDDLKNIMREAMTLLSRSSTSPK